MKALAVGVVLFAVAGAETAWAAGPFDGSWMVTQTCAPTGDDVRGYAWSFPATVRNGVLSGQHSPSGSGDGSGRLQGKIKADGSALLSANGVTGRPEFSVGHVAQGHPFHFHVQAQFTEASGTGSRIELRQCDFTFARQ